MNILRSDGALLLGKGEALEMRRVARMDQSDLLWSDRWGSECHKDLIQKDDDVRVFKGTDPRIDSYSALYDNAKYKQTTMLQVLRAKKVTHVYLCGLALDVCVAFSALHCAEEGFVTTVRSQCVSPMFSNHSLIAHGSCRTLAVLWLRSCWTRAREFPRLGSPRKRS